MSQPHSDDIARDPSDGSSTEAATRGDENLSVEITSALVGEDILLEYPASESPVIDCRRLDIPEGEITAIVGPNGSGKSTLLKALSGHLRPAGGEIVLDGERLASYGQQELARTVGHLSQENVAPESITVEELVIHGRYPHRGFLEPITDGDREIVNRAIDLADVGHLRDKEIGQLSGGQKQLVWIAMVLAQDTDVLLLDEPTTFLDLNHQLRVMETLQELNAEENVTITVVLHDIAQAVRYADYLIALKDGGVYDWGPPASMITESLLADVFEVQATIEPDPEGRPLVVPEGPIQER